MEETLTQARDNEMRYACNIASSREHPKITRTDLNLVRDAYKQSIPYPLIFILSNHALMRLIKFAPDFWAWRSGVFIFKTIQETKDYAVQTIQNHNDSYGQINKAERRERIDFLKGLLEEDYPHGKKILPEKLDPYLTILNQLGEAYLDLGNAPEAREYLEEALKLVLNRDNSSLKADIYRNLGRAYEYLGKYQEELTYYQQSLAICKEIGDRKGEAKSYKGLGNAYDYLAKYQEALTHYQQSLAIFKEIGDRKGEATAYDNLGIVYQYLGKYQEALPYHHQSLAIRKEIDDRNGEAYSYNNLGTIYHSLGKYQEALTYYQQSLAIRKEIGDRHGEAKTWFNLGLARNKLGQKAEAKAAFLRARELYQAMGLDTKVRDCDNLI